MGIILRNNRTVPTTAAKGIILRNNRTVPTTAAKDSIDRSKYFCQSVPKVNKKYSTKPISILYYYMYIAIKKSQRISRISRTGHRQTAFMTFECAERIDPNKFFRPSEKPPNRKKNAIKFFFPTGLEKFLSFELSFEKKSLEKFRKDFKERIL
jgi:hypothetical protein